MCLLKGLHLRHFSLSRPSNFYVPSLISPLVSSNRDDLRCLIRERVVQHRSTVPPFDPPAAAPASTLFSLHAHLYIFFFCVRLIDATQKLRLDLRRNQAFK